MTTKTTHDGGTAFPIPGLQHDESFNGMSLRDYFAAAALQGLLASPQQGVTTTDMYARDAYRLADAMLCQRAA
jgi:hypothetical protein